MGIKELTRTLQKYAKENAPALLTGIGIACGVACTITAVKKTPKAMQLMAERKDELDTDKLSTTEVIKSTYKCYISPVLLGSVAIACIIGANSENAKRNAALATAYAITDTAFREYKDKVVEVIGEKKAQNVQDELSKDRLNRHKLVESNVIETGHGKTLCYDAFCGRYFMSDMEHIRKAVNDLNEQLLMDGSVCVNDFYYLIDLPTGKSGDYMGWDSRTGQVRLDFSSHIAAGGTPCIVVDFAVSPRYDYYR